MKIGTTCRHAGLLLMVALACGARAQDAPPKPKMKAQPLFAVQLDHDFTNPDQAFEEVRKLILDNYYTNIDEDALYWAAIRGMLRHVSPPEHPTLGKLMKPEEFKEFHDSLQGVEESIGIESSYNKTDGSLTIKNIPKGSPSEGILQPLDRIMRIDGEPLKGKTPEQITAMLHGQAGTEVKLTVVRDIEILELTVVRQRFEVPNLEVLQLKNNTAYIGLSRFTTAISQDMKKELIALQDKGVTKLIIDFRNNSGGIFAEALRVAELFLPAKSIVMRSASHGDSVKNYVSGNQEPLDFDIAVVVNEKTASSCEIVTAALQDHDKAQVVGEHTYGKAVFEKTFALQNKYRAKFIIGAMYSPKGKTWHDKGVLPDYFVHQKEGTYNALSKLNLSDRCNKDVQLITAYRILNRDQ